MDIGLCTGFGISPLQRKVLDKNPERWLCYVFRRIKKTAKDKFVDLLAHRWQLATVTAWAQNQMIFS